MCQIWSLQDVRRMYNAALDTQPSCPLRCFAVAAVAVTARSRRGELSTIFDDARTASAAATARESSSGSKQQLRQQQAEGQEQQQQSVGVEVQPDSDCAAEPAEHNAAAVAG
jgi:hypothetical protein